MQTTNPFELLDTEGEEPAPLTPEALVDVKPKKETKGIKQLQPIELWPWAGKHHCASQGCMRVPSTHHPACNLHRCHHCPRGIIHPSKFRLVNVPVELSSHTCDACLHKTATCDQCGASVLTHIRPDSNIHYCAQHQPYKCCHKDCKTIVLTTYHDNTELEVFCEKHSCTHGAGNNRCRLEPTKPDGCCDKHSRGYCQYEYGCTTKLGNKDEQSHACALHRCTFADGKCVWPCRGGHKTCGLHDPDNNSSLRTTLLRAPKYCLHPLCTTMFWSFHRPSEFELSQRRFYKATTTTGTETDKKEKKEEEEEEPHACATHRCKLCFIHPVQVEIAGVQYDDEYHALYTPAGTTQCSICEVCATSRRCGIKECKEPISRLFKDDHGFCTQHQPQTCAHRFCETVVYAPKCVYVSKNGSVSKIRLCCPVHACEHVDKHTGEPCRWPSWQRDACVKHTTSMCTFGVGMPIHEPDFMDDHIYARQNGCGDEPVNAKQAPWCARHRCVVMIPGKQQPRQCYNPLVPSLIQDGLPPRCHVHSKHKPA